MIDGRILPLIMEVEVELSDLSKEDRATLLGHCCLNQSNVLIAGKSPDNPEHLDCETVADVITHYRKVDVVLAANDAVEELRKAKAAKEEVIQLHLFLANQPTVLGSQFVQTDSWLWNEHNVSEYLTRAVENTVIRAGTLVDEPMRKALTAEVARREALRVAAFQAKLDQVADEKAKLELIKNDLREWALANGSELVRLRIAESQNWQEIARKEWTMTHLPSGFQIQANKTVRGYTFDSTYDIKNATLDELKLLRTAREAYSFGSSLRLVCVKFLEDKDEDGCYAGESRGVKHFDYIEGQIAAPDGTNVWIDRLLSEGNEFEDEDEDEDDNDN